MNFDEVCRTCLRSDRSLSSLFDSKLTDLGISPPFDVIRLLTSFTELLISCNDEFPQQICSECLDEIAQTYSFKLKCESSNVILKQIKNTRKVSIITMLCENECYDNKCLLETDTETFESIQPSIMHSCQMKSENIGPIGDSDQSGTNICQIKSESIESISDNDQSVKNIDRINAEINDSSSSNIYGIRYDNIKTNADSDQFLDIPEVRTDEINSDNLLGETLLENEKDHSQSDTQSVFVKNEPEINITMESEECDSENYDSADLMVGDNFKCSGCPKKCLSLGGLRKHFIASHMTRHFCKICNKGFKGSLRDHCLQHLPIPNQISEFLCPICSRSFNRKSNLVRHNKSHTKEKPFKCEICLKRFRDKHSITYHTRVTHPIDESEVFQCKICSKIFGNKSHLIRHALSHTNNRPYKCDICLKYFRRKHNLTIHSRTKHVDESTIRTDLQCKTCLRLCSSKSHLIRHSRSHTEERPFVCEICSKSFRHKNNLTHHLKVVKHTETD